jgi:hypothetical protein
VTVSVDVNANRRAINPAIYGVAYVTTTQLPHSAHEEWSPRR